MATQRQILANRANAKKSTGPKTTSGKSLSLKNALRHGLTAEKIIVPGETAEEFEALRAELYREHCPETVSERELVDVIATLQWRLRRAAIFESSLLNVEAPSVPRLVITVVPVDGRPDPDLPDAAPSQNSDKEDESYLGHTEESDRSDDNFDVPTSYQPPPPVAFKASDLDQVDRHQTALLNALIKALHLLFVLQSRRVNGG